MKVLHGETERIRRGSGVSLRRNRHRVDGRAKEHLWASASGDCATHARGEE